MAENIFNTIKVDSPPYSWFDLSHDIKTTLDMGILYPILCHEVIPGDKTKLASNAMFRLQPMVAPIIHKVDIYIHHFFVPNRITWKNWEKFIATPHPDSEAPLMPYMFTLGSPVVAGDMANRLGMPVDFNFNGPQSELDNPISLPFAAYQAIWFEYYRAQDIQETTFESMYDFCGLADGPTSEEQFERLSTLRRRAWEHDYYTSALPFAQKGEAVTIPIDISTPIDIPVNFQATGQAWQVLGQDGAAPGTLPDYLTSFGGGADNNLATGDSPSVYYTMNPRDTLRAQGVGTDTETSTTINDLRASYALQKFFERSARAGTRYTEVIKANFGVTSSDARLQRPEYLGGSKSTVAISEVLNTTGQDSVFAAPLGEMGGHGIAIMDGNQASHYAEEHGFIMSLLSVRPKSSYLQGVPKFLNRRDKMDYYWPDFAQLGEEPVKNKELYYQNFPGNTNQETFGYLPRFSEYRFIPSRVNGDIATNLAYWSLHREFDDIPALNTEFIECKPSPRIWAVDPEVGGDPIIAHIYHSISARRPLPKYGNPAGLI